MLRWNDKSTKVKFEIILGVLELNILADIEFVQKLEYYVINFISKTNEKIDKYDIDNGIFSRLQNNENLKKEKYELINFLREKMWIDNSNSMTNEEVKKLFSL
jgi:hypothetical protein